LIIVCGKTCQIFRITKLEKNKLWLPTSWPVALICWMQENASNQDVLLVLHIQGTNIYACCGDLCFYGSSTMTKTGNAAHPCLVSTRWMYTWSSLTCALSVSNNNLGYVAFVQTLLKFMATHVAYSWGFCFLMHEPQTTCFKKCKVHHLHKQSQFLSLEESLTFPVHAEYSLLMRSLLLEARAQAGSWNLLAYCFKNVQYILFTINHKFMNFQRFWAPCSAFPGLFEISTGGSSFKKMLVFLANLNFFFFPHEWWK